MRARSSGAWLAVSPSMKAKRLGMAVLALSWCALGACTSSNDASEIEGDEGELRSTDAARALAKTAAVELEVTELPNDGHEEMHATVTVPATIAKIIQLKKTRERARSEAACTGYKANLRF